MKMKIGVIFDSFLKNNLAVKGLVYWYFNAEIPWKLK